MNDDSQPSDEAARGTAKALSALGASKGGRARAELLTPEQRREIARTAVEARWARQGKTPLPRATHMGTLKVGEIEFECAVLDDETRVISETRFMSSMGMYRSGALSVRRKAEDDPTVPLFLAHKNIRPFAEHHLGGGDSSLLRFVALNGSVANGIPAEIIPKVCEVWLDGERAGVLGPHQKTVARKADILLRGLARVGIVALVDEATGYQDVRAKNALAKILEAFVAKGLRPWVRTFPLEYYKQIYRLWEWNFPDDAAKQAKRPMFIGKLTNNIIYDRLAPGVRAELHRVTPRDERGRLKNKLHQRLTEDVGHPKLLEHLAAVVAIAKISPNRQTFLVNLDMALPAYGKTLPLPLPPIE